jgi:hypothetical protein
MNNRRHGMYVFLLIFLILIFYGGCGDDSNPTNGSGTQKEVSYPLNGVLMDIQLTADQPAQFTFTLQAPNDMGIIQSASLDIVSTLQNLTATTPNTLSKLEVLASMLTNQSTGQAMIKVGSDENTVCYQNTSYGPYEISTDFFTNPDPQNIPLNSETIAMLNYGYIVLCLELVSSVDATFSIDQIDADVTETECAAPSNFAGLWRGTFTCSNSCGEPFGDSVFITVTQDGHTASYTDDAGDTYTGRVCGNEFRFKRINSPYDEEWGTLVLSDASHATKRSTWRSSYSPYCQGDCIDYLTRVPQGD